VSGASWDDYRLLLALSRGKSIAGGARILGVDSSTVSRQLAAMERSLGACLVLRGGREFTFTAEGKAAVVAAEEIESIVANAARAIRAAKSDLDGVVRVSVVPSMLRILMPLLAIASEKHPKLSIELSAANHTVSLAKGDADIAVRMTQPTELDLVARRAIEMSFGVFASKSYAARCGLPVTPDELIRHRLIQYAETMLHLPWFAWIESYSSKGAPVSRADSTEMALGLISTGMGVGVLPCIMGDHAPDLVRVFPEPVAYASGWIVYHETARNSARVRAVADMIAGFLEIEAVALSGRLVSSDRSR
jgi:DNA-binding transcriptional LysR family regulator